MDNMKIRIKVGEHEFEGDGPVDVVQQNLAAFRELITSLPTPKKEEPPTPIAPATPAPEPNGNGTPLPHLPLEKILKVEGRVVSLTAKCDSIDEAVLLILLGQKEFRSNQEVTGSELMDGLKQSGYILTRVDYTLDKLSSNGDVITIGIRRGRRYRMTNQGLRTALGIAKEVLATVV